MKSTQKGFTLIELMIVVAIIAILAAIAIPQYQAYVIRSQVNRVMGETGDQKVVVEDCLNNGASATTLVPGTANANDTSCIETATSSDLLASATNSGVPEISLGTTTSTIISTFGDHANTVISGSTLTWTRNSSGAWTCATNVASQYAPGGCPVAAATGGG
jgi:type IV pilus assembly protein PilA